MPQLERDGTSIHWEAHGEGEPLLLVMGFGLGREAWTPMLQLLGERRVVLLDNRGTGESGPPRPGTSLADMAADCIAVLDAAEIDRASVFGVSMGGMIAQLLALDHPERVSALVLGCTTPSVLRFIGDPQATVDLFTGSALMRDDPDAALDILLPLVFSTSFLAENPAVRELGRAQAASSAPPEVLEITMRAIVDLETGVSFDVADRLGEITAPTLVQHGDADLIIPVEAGRHLGATIPGAEFSEFAGAGHGYTLERPIEVCDQVCGFLAAHPIGAAR